jgi:hypothetical protein
MLPDTRRYGKMFLLLVLVVYLQLSVTHCIREKKYEEVSRNTGTGKEA